MGAIMEIDKPATYHRPARITRDEQAMIEAHIAMHGITPCPPAKHARPEWGGGPMTWRQQNEATWRNTRIKRVKNKAA